MYCICLESFPISHRSYLTPLIAGFTTREFVPIMADVSTSLEDSAICAYEKIDQMNSTACSDNIPSFGDAKENQVHVVTKEIGKSALTEFFII